MAMIIFDFIALYSILHVAFAAASVAVNQDSSILVTGAAGFIGFHLVNHLHQIGIRNVIGLDTFNAYYSPSIKRSRSFLSLSENNITVVDGDLCNATLLADLFAEHKFTHVVNLAAQAGVRYSLKSPLNYIHTNVECFTVLLEQVRAVGIQSGVAAMPHLLYASSSSIYGKNLKIPFSEIDPVNKPANLYGATKRMNELLAYSYHHLFGVKSIGFRFFTVYGPWGRPDMAAYIFTDKMLRGQQITVYNEGKMKRDFTYIDDIVAGITASLDYKHDQPAVFNLGNNKPVEALYFVDLIAKSLGVKVNMRFEDSRAEIPITYANTTLANQELGFLAVTSIEQGIEKFISWYKDREKALIMCDSGCALIPNLCSASSESATIAWKEVRKESLSLTASCETVVYSYSFNNRPHRDTTATSASSSTASTAANTNTQQKGPVCHIAFIYGASSSGRMEEFGSEWSTITIPSAHQANDLHEYSRILKISPGEFFAPTVKTAIFLDSRVKLKVQPEELVKYLDAQDGDGAKKHATLVVVKHPHIEDIYSWPTGRHSSGSSSSSSSNSSSHAQLSMQLRAYQDYQVRNGYKYDNLFEVAMFVHDLQKMTPNGNGNGNNEGHSLRCDWYREAREWKPFAASSYQLAATFVLAKRRSEALALATKANYEHLGNMKTEQEWIPINFDSDSNLPRYVRVLPSHSHYTLYEAKKQL